MQVHLSNYSMKPFLPSIITASLLECGCSRDLPELVLAYLRGLNGK